MVTIAFKDAGDGFYQTEVENDNDVPTWAEGMTKLTDMERIAAFAYEQQPSTENNGTSL